MAYDPNLPANHAPIVSQELRDQFNGLKALIDAQQATIDAQQTQITAQQATIDGQQTQINDVRAQANGAALMPDLTILDTEFHDPPTEADLEVFRNYINDMASQLQGGW